MSASPEHWIPPLVTLFAAAIVCALARLDPERWGRPLTWAMAVATAGAMASWWVYTRGSWTLAGSLPLDICDVAALVAAAALLWRHQLLIEITYFWGLTGTALALVTPATTGAYPSFPYLQYNFQHATIVVSAALLVIGLRHRPASGALPRIVLVTIAFAALVGIVDRLTGGNYMFLRQTPPGHTLLDLMGPWPIYIPVAIVIGVGLFGLLYLPFGLTPARPVGIESKQVA